MHTELHMVWGLSKHLAFGYLLYSLAQHVRGRSPTGMTTGVLALGIVFPDLIDKPLTFLGILEYGRGPAHSLLIAGPIIVIVHLFSNRWNHPEFGTAFAVGYISHIPVDMYGPLLTGHHSIDTAFLFWPVVIEYPLGILPPYLPISRYLLFSVIIAGAFCLWVYDMIPVLFDLPSIPDLESDILGLKGP